DAGEHGDLALGDAKADVFEVVLAGAANLDVLRHRYVLLISAFDRRDDAHGWDVERCAAIRMTPTLASMAIFVPNGSDSFCRRCRMRCAMAGGAVIGSPRRDSGPSCRDQIGYTRTSCSCPLSNLLTAIALS